MNPSPICTLRELAAAVPDGAKLAVPSDHCGVAMAATRELVRRGVRGLHLVCVPIGGLQAGRKGLLFIALCGLIGSDVLASRADWKIIDNPFQPGDAIAETYPRFASTFAV